MSSDPGSTTSTEPGDPGGATVALGEPPTPDLTATSGSVSPARPVAPYQVRSPLKWIRDVQAAPPGQRWLALAGVLGVLVAFAGVVVAYGLLPGYLPDPVDFYSGSGVASCVAHDFPAHLFSCPSIGYPTGYRAPFGQPVLWVSGTLQWLGIDPVNATRLTWLFFLAVGFWGARRLFARVTAVGWLAWAGVLAFLLAPIVSTQGGYGALQLGFVLVPTYLLMDLRVAEALTARLGTRTLVLRVVALVVVRTLGLMMDPYSFFIAAVGVVAIWLVWAFRALRRRQIRSVLIAAAVVLGSFVVAYLVYSRSVDTSGFTSESLDYFRGAAVDVYGLLVPSDLVWWADLTGLHHNVAPLQAYNDGHNINDVYLGVLLLGLVVLGLVAGGRKRIDGGPGTGVRLAAGLAGLAAFLLALGPSLRFEDFRIVSPGATVTYTMPASAAGFTTPWSWVYEHIPGISDMRAVWRWELGVRLAAVVLAVLGLSWWVARTSSWRTRWVPLVLAAAMVVEAIGNIPFSLKHEHVYLGNARAVEAEVTEPLAALVKPGERAILYGPGGVSPGNNDYMANFICSEAAISCYNVGGDKALGAALPKMPKVAQEVIAGHAGLGDAGVEERLRTMFQAGQLDAVVLVNFDLAAQAVTWPPAEAARNKALLAGQKMFTGGGFSRVETPYFTVIRPAP